jgi:hypothetical protein
MDIVERLRREASKQDMLACEDMLQAADVIEQLQAENARLREALLVNGLRWSAGTKEEITAEIGRIARGEYKCRCGRLYRTPGGLEECLATNHTQQEPSDVTVRRERDEEWK